MALLVATGAARADPGPIPSLYGDPEPFRAAIDDARPPALARPFPVTGITVPHHLLAADLIARGFWAAAGNRYDRIVILSPDHFSRSRTAFATTARDFDTVFGRIGTDADAVRALLGAGDLFGESDLFDREHGVGALLPFVKRLFPEARIVPVAVSLKAGPAEWGRAATLVQAIVTPSTLVVQSTDYSHYLPLAQSLARDQETLNVIAADDIEAVTRLVSSDHMDSRAAQLIHMRLQRAAGSRATVIGSRSSIEYVPHASRLTSYIVSVYSPDVAAFPRSYPDQEVMVFGGDVFAGRWLTKLLADPEIAAELVRRVTALTGGAPLVVNLEGAMLAEPPEGLPDHLHAMPAGLALPLLEALHVRAAGLANNHAFDLGRDGHRETIATLRGAGILPLPHDATVDLGAVRVIALNFVGRNDRSGFPVVRDGDLDRLCRDPARPPLVAFVHWGTEYVADLGPREREAARDLQRCGATAVVGAHSHRASDRIEAPDGGAFALLPSLGNLLFDQTAARGSGTLIEMRRFRQGTIAWRLLPLPNLFDLGNAALRAKGGGGSNEASPPPP